MSETEEDRRFYQAAEAAFIRRRGTPFLLSPRDFALLQQWRTLAVPIEAVEQGIEQAFSRREERAARGRVNSLSYCEDAVLEAWERRAEMSVGRGGIGAGAVPDVARAIAGFQAQLADLARRRPDLAAPIESAARSLERLGKSGKNAGDIEASLARLDKRLAQALADALPAAEGASLSQAVEGSLKRVSAVMDAGAVERTARALMRRALREHLGLPRLTLL
jgi:hypothetical protein